jgi:WD40 repeat protein/tetratricopeptide (TPR) repeat protein
MGEPGRCTSCGMPAAALETTDGLCDRCRSASEAGDVSQATATGERALAGRERTFARTPGEATPAPDLTETFDRGAPKADQSTEPDSAASAPGDALRQFGDYAIESELGRGGMGVVYRARQISLNRPVALKMVKAGLLADSHELRRFQNEAEAVAALDHPHIVPIYEVGDRDGKKYFSMKLVGGGSLVSQLPRFHEDPEAAARLVATAAEAIHHAHQRGILHRDLKPANILIDDHDTPYVTDFGLARRIESDSDLTISGAILGTPAYMSPEQASGRRGAVTTAADVYGLGAILYALLTGSAPSSGDNIVEVLDRVRNRPPAPPSRQNPTVPRDLEVVCMKCLEKDPSSRYPSARELALELRRFLAGEPILARPVGPFERARRWCRAHQLVTSLAASLATLLIGGTIAAVWAAIGYRDLAFRERNSASAEKTARKLADDLSVREQAAAEAAQRAAAEADRLRKVAEAESAENRKRLEARLVSSGVEPLEKGDLLGALPWFAEALKVDGDDPVRGPLHRVRMATSLARAPRLVNAVFVSGIAGPVEFAADGAGIISATDRTITLVDMATARREEFALDIPLPIKSLRFTRDARFAASLSVQRRPGAEGSTSEILAWDVRARRRLGVPVTVEGEVAVIAISPDGQRVAFASPPPGAAEASVHTTIHVLDTKTGRDAFAPIEVDAKLNQMGFAGAGRFLVAEFGRFAVFPFKFFVQVWNAETGRLLCPALEQASSFGSWELSSDATRLAIVANATPTARSAAFVWDLKAGKLLAGPLRDGTKTAGRILRAVLSPDGRLLATGGTIDVRVWNSSTGTLAGEPLPIGPTEWLSFSADGRLLTTTGGPFDETQVWDVRSMTAVLPPLRQGLGSFHPGGQLLLTLEHDPETRNVQARVWDLRREAGPSGTQRQMPGNLLWNDAEGNSVVVLDTGRPGYIPLDLPPPPESKLRVLDRQTADPLSKPLPLEGRGIVIDVGVSRDGSRVVAAVEPAPSVVRGPGGAPRLAPPKDQSPSILMIWDAASGHTIGDPIAIPKPATFAALSPDGRYAAVVVRDNQARQEFLRYDTTGVWLCDLEARRGVFVPVRAGRRVVLAAFSPDSRRLLTVQSGFARLWDSRTAEPIGPAVESPQISPFVLHAEINSTLGQARCAGFSADGAKVAIGIGGPQVFQIDPSTGAAAAPALETGSGIRAVRYSANGRRLITAGGSVRIWDAASGRALTPPLYLATPEAARASQQGMRDGVHDVALSADGTLAAACGGLSLRVWDASSGAPLAPAIAIDSDHRIRWPSNYRLDMVSRSRRSVRILDFKPDERSLADLQALAQLLSGRRIDDVAGPVAADFSAQSIAWNTFRGKAPELPEQATEDLVVSHGRIASEAEQSGQWYAAATHLGQLIAARPHDSSLRRRRAEALARLGQFDRAAEDLARVQPSDLFHPDVFEARTVLAAWQRDATTYNAMSGRALALMGNRNLIRAFASRPDQFWLTVLAPSSSTRAQEVLAACDAVLESSPGNPAFLALHGAACFRCNRFERARQDLRESIASYGRKLSETVSRMPLFAKRPIVTDAAQVSPGCDEGTPREWVFLAMVEKRLGHVEAAKAWLAQTSKWLTMASHDPPDPAAFGGLSDPPSRAMVRMNAGGNVALTMRPLIEQFLGSWRQLLAIKVLEREATELIDGTGELPGDVFAPN